MLRTLGLPLLIICFSDVMPRSLSQMPYLAVFLIEVLLEGLLAMLVSLMIVGKYLKEVGDLLA